MLSKKNKDLLEKKGIEIFDNNNRFHFSKKIGAGGNSMPFYKKVPIVIIGKEEEEEEELYTSCPSITLWIEKNKYRVMCWDWVPGPGPGDFDIEFDNEDAAINFVDSYYFGENEYYEARKNYVIQSRNTINVQDIKSIFEHLITKLEKTFTNSEIEFGESGIFHKVPYDTWRIAKFEEEEPSIKVKTGFLKNEIYRLRRKIGENAEFDFEDVNNISDLLFELSLLLREKIDFNDKKG